MDQYQERVAYYGDRLASSVNPIYDQLNEYSQVGDVCVWLESVGAVLDTRKQGATIYLKYITDSSVTCTKCRPSWVYSVMQHCSDLTEETSIKCNHVHSQLDSVKESVGSFLEKPLHYTYELKMNVYNSIQNLLEAIRDISRIFTGICHTVLFTSHYRFTTNLCLLFICLPTVVLLFKILFSPFLSSSVIFHLSSFPSSVIFDSTCLPLELFHPTFLSPHYLSFFRK